MNRMFFLWKKIFVIVAVCSLCIMRSAEAVSPLPITVPSVEAPVVSAEFSQQAQKVEDSLFHVVDEKRDEADLGNGRKAVRIFKEPRLIYTDADGSKKVRPSGWNMFDQNAKSKIQRQSTVGYQYSVPMKNGQQVVVRSGVMQTITGSKKQSVAPSRAVLRQSVVSTASHNQFINVYPSVDVQFTDAGQYRDRRITVKDRFLSLPDDASIVFWEYYTIPKDATVLVDNQPLLSNGTTKEAVLVQFKNGEIFSIGKAKMFDSKLDDEMYIDLNQSPVQEMVEYDKSTGTLSLGLVLPVSYLHDTSKVMPIVIDPTYTTCTDASTCPKNLYLKWSPGANSYEEGTDTLFMGYDYTSGVGACTPANIATVRAPLLKFTNLESYIPAGSTINWAYFYMRYKTDNTNNGCGEYTSYIAMKPKKINTSWSGAAPTYDAVRGNLTDGGSSTNIGPNGGCVSGNCLWYLSTSMVKGWIDTPSTNYGFIIEPEANFSSGNTPPASWTAQQRLFLFRSSRYGSGADRPYMDIVYTLPKPDLTDNVSNISPGSLAPGDAINMGFRIKNVGGSTAAASVLKYYFNPSSSCGNVVSPVGSVNVPALGVNATSQQNATYTVPASTAPGSYCLMYWIDANNAVDESNENNNGWSVPITVTAPARPDLTKTGDSLNKTNFVPGESINSSITVKNQGTALSGATIVSYYFNKNTASYSTGYVGQSALASLGVNATTGVNFNYTIPANTQPGTYYLTYAIDSSGVVTESNETNNQYAFAVITVAGQPDIVPSSATLTDTSMRYSGLAQTVTVRTRLQNTGPVAANNVTYRLTLRDTTSQATYQMTNLTPATFSLAAGYDATVNMTGTVPDGMPYSGQYAVDVQFDPSGSIAESNENNNITTTNNTVVVMQYFYNSGGGGGGGSGTVRPVEAVTSGVLVASASNAMIGPSLSNQYKKTSDTYTADPVNARTGALEFSQTDFALPESVGIPIKFVRTFNSKTVDRNARLGRGWSNSYNIYYYQDANTKNVQVYLGGALTSLFTTNDGGQTFIAEKGDPSVLYRDGNYLSYRTLDGIVYKMSLQLTNNMGLIQQIVDTNGNITTVGYATIRDIPLLSSVTDATGRAINFVYPSDTTASDWDKIKEVREHNGGVDWLIERYTYNNNLDLINIHQDVSNIDHAFTYDGAGRMLTYTDPRGTILTNVYDANGRVTDQYEHNPRVDGATTSVKRRIYHLNYIDEPDADVAGSTHCAITETYRDATAHYDEKNCYNADELLIYSARGANVEHWSYDGAGMMSAYTDANGAVTSYTYDAKRRLAQEVLPDISAGHTVTNYTYADSQMFSRVKTKTVVFTPATGASQTRVLSYDVNPANGNINSITDPRLQSEFFTYNTNGTVRTHTGKNGYVTTYEYDANGYETSASGVVTLPDGTTQTVATSATYNPYGQKITSTDARGNTTNYFYELPRRNLSRINKPDAASVLFAYDAEDHITDAIDELGHVTHTVYDTDINASVLSVQKNGASGPIINRREYDFAGNVVKEIDPLSREVSYVYDSANRVIEAHDPVKTATREYYPNGLLKKETNTAGQRTDYQYDARGNKVQTQLYSSAVDAVSNEWAYDGFNQITSKLDGLSHRTTYEYDALGHVVTTTDPYLQKTVYTYDAEGNKIGELTPRAVASSSFRNSEGYSNSFKYDGLNRLVQTTNADGKKTQYFRDSNGNIVRLIDRMSADGSANTHITAYSYDANNKKISEIAADGTVQLWTYDKAGNMQTATDEMSRTRTYTYDDFNRKVKEQDPVGNETTYTYDKSSNLLSVSYPDHSSVQYAYDEMNHVTLVTDEQNNVDQFAYDTAGNKVLAKDANNHSTTFAYDALRRLTSETNDAGMQVVYTYDGNSNRLTENVNGKTTSFEYDFNNLLKRTTYPGGKTEDVTFDANGNKATIIDGKGQTTAFTYDALNRTTQKALADGTLVLYGYDNWNNLVSVADSSGTIANSYDVRNRVIGDVKTISGLVGKTYTTSRTYAGDGSLETLTDAGGRVVRYEYDARGFLHNIFFGSTPLAVYNYTSFGLPQSIVYGNGVYTDFTYDLAHRTSSLLTRNSAGPLVSQTYAYDAVGNRVQLTDTRWNGGVPQTSTTTYSYNDLDELIRASYAMPDGATSTLSYDYDASGNRISLGTPWGATAYTYASDSNALNQYIVNGRQSVDILYDGNGSVQKETYTRLGALEKEISYGWNADRRLASVIYHAAPRGMGMPALPDTTVSFQYDDAGNRIKKSINGANAVYYINNGVSVLNELDDVGTVTKSVIAGLEQVAEIDTAGHVSYTHHDALGSTILVTDDQGQVVQEYEYDPFGQILGADGNSDTRYTYTGQEWDPESDLYYYNARYYDPATGRFLSCDPQPGRDGDLLSRNRYIYVKNNPLKYADPTGMEEENWSDKAASVFRYIFGIETAYAPDENIVFPPPGENDTLWSDDGPIEQINNSPLTPIVLLFLTDGASEAPTVAAKGAQLYGGLSKEVIQNSKTIASGAENTLKAASRLVQENGGKTVDWVKNVSKEIFTSPTGLRYQYHYFMNVVTEEVVQAKAVFIDLIK